jgi:hypothetical protein
MKHDTMPSVGSGTIRQHCSVCKTDFDMEIIKQGSSENVVWLKCPGCQGFLPYMPDEDPAADSQETAGEKPVALEDLDVENAKEYSEVDTYQVGDVVHHRSWNDFGRVLEKAPLPGNRHTIWVQFLRQGKVQLLEGVVH